ncbi:MAG: hypothetical protein KDB07_07365 [Planctomycetes bacterium]|nr:hypothetical protein [Planctomycetota bacterium]
MNSYQNRLEGLPYGALELIAQGLDVVDQEKVGYILPVTEGPTVETDAYPHGMTTQEAKLFDKVASADRMGRHMAKRAFEVGGNPYEAGLKNQTSEAARGITSGLGGGLAGGALGYMLGRRSPVATAAGAGIGALAGGALGVQQARAARLAQDVREGKASPEEMGFLARNEQRIYENADDPTYQALQGAGLIGIPAAAMGHELGGSRGAVIGGLAGGALGAGAGYLDSRGFAEAKKKLEGQAQAQRSAPTTKEGSQQKRAAIHEYLAKKEKDNCGTGAKESALTGRVGKTLAGQAENKFGNWARSAKNVFGPTSVSRYGNAW